MGTTRPEPAALQDAPSKEQPVLLSLDHGLAMLAKLTSRNRLTLPKEVLASLRGTKYFDVTEDNGCIVLTPVRIDRAGAVRAKLADLGISGADVADAVSWARDGAKDTG